MLGGARLYNSVGCILSLISDLVAFSALSFYTKFFHTAAIPQPYRSHTGSTGTVKMCILLPRIVQVKLIQNTVG